MKRKRSIFSSLMLAYSIIILLCIMLLYALFYFTLKDVQTSNRVAMLKKHAYDISDLIVASSVSGAQTEKNELNKILENKLMSLYKDYDAFCMVVDKYGKGITFFLSIIEDKQELKSTFDSNNIISTLNTVLHGEEVISTVNSSFGPMYTVSIPLISKEKIIGAVYIQTAAQNIHQSYLQLATKTGMIVTVVFLFSALIGWYFNKKLTLPLRKLSAAVKKISQGNFEIVLDEVNTLEIDEVSSAFNSMTKQLSKIDKNRKDFLANVSHELRSPMTNVQGFVEGMLDGTIEAQDTNKYLQIVLNESKRMNKLINSLLNLSQIENDDIPLEVHPFNINEIIRQALIPNINRIETKNIILDLCVDDRPLMVLGDKGKIEQVIFNLIDNAIKFTPEKGQISIITKTYEKKVHFIINDSGSGILPEDISHIFDRFYMSEKSHTSGKGTGLGLAICKKIMDKHKEPLNVQSRYGEGASFEFTLPLV